MLAGAEGPSGSKKRPREDELSCTLPEDYVSAACRQHSDSMRSCLVLPAHGHLFLLMLLVVCIVSLNTLWQKEQWIKLPRLGRPVGNGLFIPCKPPLRSAAGEGLDEGDRC